MNGSAANISVYGEKCCQFFMIWFVSVLPMFEDIKGSAENVQDMVESAVQVSGKCCQCFMLL